MAIFHCPRCNAPLLPDEAQGGVCPDCQGSLATPDAPVSSAPEATVPPPLRRAWLVGVVGLCLLLGGVLIWRMSEDAEPDGSLAAFDASKSRVSERPAPEKKAAKTPSVSPPVVPEKKEVKEPSKSPAPVKSDEKAPSKTETPVVAKKEDPPKESVLGFVKPSARPPVTAAKTGEARLPMPVVAGNLRVDYKCADPAPDRNQIRFDVRIVNGGAEAVPLAELTLRYWFTAPSEKRLNYWCDYAVLGGAHVHASFHKLPKAAKGADRYLEIGFKPAAPKLGGGKDSGQIQSRVALADWSSFHQARDYSFEPKNTRWAPAPRITLYRKGALIWGSEPAGPGLIPFPILGVKLGDDEDFDLRFAALEFTTELPAKGK
ncbi:MAG: cellulose binding domain-containing protein [Gemmataceae bacterium]